MTILTALFFLMACQSPLIPSKEAKFTAIFSRVEPEKGQSVARFEEDKIQVHVEKYEEWSKCYNFQLSDT
jgi:hypothetical protein